MWLFLLLLVLKCNFILYHKLGSSIGINGFLITLHMAVFGLFLVQILLEGHPQHLDLLLPLLEAFNGLLYSKLDGPSWVAHVVDNHVHEDPVGVNLRT